MYILLIVAFIDMFSQLPVIAPFATSLGATPLIVGSVIGVYSFSNMLGNVLSGIWVDKFGSKRILASSMILAGILVFFYTYVTNPTQLLAIRFFHGFAAGFIVPAAFAAIGRNDDSQSSGKKMSHSGAAIGIAAIIGPAMGAILTGRLGIEWLFYVVSLALILIGFTSLVFIKSKPVTLIKSAIKEEIGFSFIKNSTIQFSYVSIFLLLLMQGILTYAMPLKVEELHLKQEMTGIYFSIFGIVAILFFILPSNRIFDRFNNSRLMLTGLFTIALSILGLGLATSSITVLLAMVFYGIGFALLFPSTSTTIMKGTNSQNRGKAFGVYYACFSLGVISGAFLAGLLGTSATLIFTVGAGIVLFVSILMLVGLKPRTLS
ncbi:MFS transporter [Paenisporosarcina sp. TG20]|uniref:MFS transporter n=1 Tax=Paenisporosarcina sp. TG20 TaxID=1211706 RepID=UPI001ED962A3|nr:MFS transporter [Paenisporosarcina sp. TG20]